jgi:hypothetical protein
MGNFCTLFKKIAQIKQLPNRWKLSQSGHPDSWRVEYSKPVQLDAFCETHNVQYFLRTTG